MLFCHKHDDSLKNLNNRREAGSENTDLDEKEKRNIRWMRAPECDVAGPITLMLFTPADMRYTLRDAGDNGRTNFEGLGVSSCKHLRVREVSNTPFRHPRALCPTFPNGLGRELG